MDGNTTSEEKKETIDASDNVNSSTMNLESNNPISSDSEMRGVHAKTNISIDAICVAIPKKCLITVEMGQATDIGQIILRSDLDLDAPKHIFLMIFLLWDLKVNGEKSFFKPYYDILPKTLSNIPIFWNNIELEYLKGSYLLTQISDRTDAITEDYDAICHVAPQLRDIASLEEFKWARMCVCSRNFGLQIDGHRTSALVPHADMLNHHRPRETKWSFDDELQAFTITT
jgi:histone-lysine N-methyltransferase SETD3